MERDLKKLVASMTLEEKAGMCSGADFWNTKAVERLGIPSVMMSDGPHGMRKQEGEADHLGLNESVEAVCFPAACATASSFDVDLIRQMGEILGEECQAEDLSMLLGPAVNIKRSPLCGRNFEYFSEDPYHAGKMAAAYVRGIQRSFVFRSKGKIWYQAFWYLIAFCIVTCIVNSINCIWVAVAGMFVPEWLYNIGTTVLNGGVSMVVFFFVNKIIFPEGEAK